MLVSPLEALCTLLPGESQGLCPIPEDLQEVRRSQGPGTEEKIRFMAPFTSPPTHKGSFKALASYTHRQAGGTWEPRLALQEQWRGSEAGVSWVPDPVCRSPSQTLALDCPC